MEIDDNHIKALKEEIKAYVEAQIDKNVYGLGDKLSRKVSNYVFSIGAIFLLFIAFLFLNIALGFALADWLDTSVAMGFLIVGGFYILLTLIWAIFKNTTLDMIKNKIAGRIIKFMDKLNAQRTFAEKVSSKIENAEIIIEKEEIKL